MTPDRWSRLAAVASRQGVLIAFGVLVSAMFATTSTFGTYQNLINVLQQNSIIGIIACGMTFAIILGGFDLSVGSVTALASVVGATLMIDLGRLGSHTSWASQAPHRKSCARKDGMSSAPRIRNTRK
jgi:ribose/xylose/arabinose/galactoside ABC-type transport system permease subunit